MWWRQGKSSTISLKEIVKGKKMTPKIGNFRGEQRKKRLRRIINVKKKEKKAN